MDKLLQRLDIAEKTIANIQDKSIRKDLLKMVKTIDSAIAAADQESVECRRIRKETIRYRDLVQSADGLLTNLEQHITFAKLLG